MLKKLIALLVVAMLMLPSAAFAADKSDAGKHKGKVKASAEAKDKKADKDAKKAEKKALKSQKKANKKLDADGTTAVHRGEGIRIAMSKIQRNIERAGEKAPMALKTVVNKFAAWLGLSQVYDDAGNLIEDATEAEDDGDKAAASTDKNTTDDVDDDDSDDDSDDSDEDDDDSDEDSDEADNIEK